MKKLAILLLVVCFALGSAGMALALDPFEVFGLQAGAVTSFDQGADTQDAVNLNDPTYSVQQAWTKLTDDADRPIRDGDVIWVVTDGNRPLDTAGWDKLNSIILDAGAYVEVVLSDDLAVRSEAHISIPAALAGNPYLSKITFGALTERIEAGAFAGCENLEVVAFDEGAASGAGSASALEFIGDNAFAGCKSLREFGPVVEHTSTVTGTLLADTSFLILSQGLSAAAPIIDGARAVGAPTRDPYDEGTACDNWNGVGPGASATPSFVIPGAVKSIGANAFAGTAVRSLYLYASTNATTTAIGDGAFQDCVNLYSATMPTFTTQRTNTTVGLTTIGDNAFSGCSNLGRSGGSVGVTTSGNLNLPSTLTTIGAGAFAKCVSIMDIPREGTVNVESIGAGAFEGCTALTGMNRNIAGASIPSTATKGGLGFPKVTTIGDRAFAGCTKLPRIGFTHYLPVIGSESFSGASALEELYYWVDVMPNNVESLLIHINAAAMGSNAFTDTKLGDGGAIYVYNGASKQAMNSIFAIEMTAQPASVDNLTTQTAVSRLSNVGFDAAAINSLTGIPVEIAEQLIGTEPGTGEPGTGEPGTGTGTPTKGSSSGGCDAGFGVFALALAGAVVLRKRVF